MEKLVRITLYEGRYHQLRRMLAVVNNRAVEIKRVSTGPLQLGDLPVGKWRLLTTEELELIGVSSRVIQANEKAIQEADKRKRDRERARERSKDKTRVMSLDEDTPEEVAQFGETRNQFNPLEEEKQVIRGETSQDEDEKRFDEFRKKMSGEWKGGDGEDDGWEYGEEEVEGDFKYGEGEEEEDDADWRFGEGDADDFNKFGEEDNDKSFAGEDLHQIRQQQIKENAQKQPWKRQQHETTQKQGKQHRSYQNFKTEDKKGKNTNTNPNPNPKPKSKPTKSSNNYRKSAAFSYSKE